MIVVAKGKKNKTEALPATVMKTLYIFFLWLNCWQSTYKWTSGRAVKVIAEN